MQLNENNQKVNQDQTNNLQNETNLIAIQQLNKLNSAV